MPQLEQDFERPPFLVCLISTPARFQDTSIRTEHHERVHQEGLSMREAPEPIQEVDLLISAGCIITMNSRRQIILDGAVAVSGADIVAVGDAREIRTRYRAHKTIDAPQGLMTPGLVDVHNHPIDYLIKGLCDDTPQLQRLRE